MLQVRYKQRQEEYLPFSIPEEAAENLAEVAEYRTRKAEAEARGETLPGDQLVRARISADSLIEAFLKGEVVEDFYSSATKSRGTAVKTTRLATFPDYLLIQLLKFKVDESWQPVKLDVEVGMPEQLDLSALRGTGIQVGEQSLPEEDAQEEPTVVIDETIVAQLVDMGFARDGCRRAVFHTGSAGAEAAMAWVMDHMGDSDFGSPFNPPGGKQAGPMVCTASEDVIAMVMSMGFERPQAEAALRNTDNNVERAVEWIFSHPEGEPASSSGSAPAPSLTVSTDGEPRWVHTTKCVNDSNIFGVQVRAECLYISYGNFKPLWPLRLSHQADQR